MHRESPRKKAHTSRAVADTLGLEKIGASPVRRSPRKLEKSTPHKRSQEEGEDEDDQDTIKSPSKKVKYFPIFYPSSRLADCKFPRGKTGKR